MVAQEEVEAAHDRASDTLDAIFPDEWKESSDEADYDLVDISLDQLEAAVSAGEPKQAEQARLSAYAFFEFGPELKLRAFDPSLVAEIEGLVWYGASGEAGLAQLIADNASIAEVRETRAALEEALNDGPREDRRGRQRHDGDHQRGDDRLPRGAGGDPDHRRDHRQPGRRPAAAAQAGLPRGAGCPARQLPALLRRPGRARIAVGLRGEAGGGGGTDRDRGPAAGDELVLPSRLLDRLDRRPPPARQGPHRSCGGRRGGRAGTIAGLYVLGFTSVLREGVETVLFLQALQLSSGTGVVLAGVGLALLATAVVGVATFKLEQRLPYKRMLVVTGVLIALVLVVLVGNTTRTLQGVGWLPITPIDIELPLWAGTWLGLFPTVETLGSQVAALVFVIGSYFLAEWMRKRNVRLAVEAGSAAQFARATNAHAPVDERPCRPSPTPLWPTSTTAPASRAPLS